MESEGNSADAIYLASANSVGQGVQILIGIIGRGVVPGSSVAKRWSTRGDSIGIGR